MSGAGSPTALRRRVASPTRPIGHQAARPPALSAVSGPHPLSGDHRHVGNRAARRSRIHARSCPRLCRRGLGWYAAHARDLPWRAPGVSPWAVLVSEIMLQQTPVSRVLPAYQAWLSRWPTPAALAADPAGEAVRQWGRLGYPRRALRLHETATIVTEKYAGELPVDSRRAAGPAGDRRLHGRRRGRLRLRPQARRPRHERPPRPGPRSSPAASSRRPSPRWPSTASPSRCCPTTTR